VQLRNIARACAKSGSCPVNLKNLANPSENERKKLSDWLWKQYGTKNAQATAANMANVQGRVHAALAQVDKEVEEQLRNPSPIQSLGQEEAIRSALQNSVKSTSWVRYVTPAIGLKVGPFGNLVFASRNYAVSLSAVKLAATKLVDVKTVVDVISYINKNAWLRNAVKFLGPGAFIAFKVYSTLEPFNEYTRLRSLRTSMNKNNALMQRMVTNDPEAYTKLKEKENLALKDLGNRAIRALADVIAAYSMYNDIKNAIKLGDTVVNLAKKGLRINRSSLARQIGIKHGFSVDTRTEISKIRLWLILGGSSVAHADAHISSIYEILQGRVDARRMQNFIYALLAVVTSMGLTGAATVSSIPRARKFVGNSWRFVTRQT